VRDRQAHEPVRHRLGAGPLEAYERAWAGTRPRLSAA
jgi:hypothetical protein